MFIGVFLRQLPLPHTPTKPPPTGTHARAHIHDCLICDSQYNVVELADMKSLRLRLQTEEKWVVAGVICYDNLISTSILCLLVAMFYGL